MLTHPSGGNSTATTIPATDEEALANARRGTQEANASNGIMPAGQSAATRPAPPVRVNSIPLLTPPEKIRKTHSIPPPIDQLSSASKMSPPESVVAPLVAVKTDPEHQCDQEKRRRRRKRKAAPADMPQAPSEPLRHDQPPSGMPACAVEGTMEHQEPGAVDPAAEPQDTPGAPAAGTSTEEHTEQTGLPALQTHTPPAPPDPAEPTPHALITPTHDGDGPGDGGQSVAPPLPMVPVESTAKVPKGLPDATPKQAPAPMQAAKKSAARPPSEKVHSPGTPVYAKAEEVPTVNELTGDPSQAARANLMRANTASQGTPSAARTPATVTAAASPEKNKTQDQGDELEQALDKEIEQNGGEGAPDDFSQHLDGLFNGIEATEAPKRPAPPEPKPPTPVKTEPASPDKPMEEPEQRKEDADIPKRRREKTPAEKAAHARFMRFSRSFERLLYGSKICVLCV